MKHIWKDADPTDFDIRLKRLSTAIRPEEKSHAMANTSGAEAQETINLNRLLDEMLDRARIAEFP